MAGPYRFSVKQIVKKKKATSSNLFSKQSILASCTPTTVEINHVSMAPFCSVHSYYGHCVQDYFCVPFILIYLFASLIMKANTLPVHFSVSVPIFFFKYFISNLHTYRKAAKIIPSILLYLSPYIANANTLHNNSLSINNRKLTLIQYFK